MKSLFSVLLVLIFFSNNIDAQSIAFTPIFSGFNSPVDIAHANDATNRLFIVEQAGRVRIIDQNGTTLSTPFLNITGKVLDGGERGLLGLAFHPDYANNGLFFINYTNNSGNTIIARYTVSSTNANIADPASEKILLQINQPFSNHNGGCIKFGADGYLYIGTGDGGSGGDPDCYSQNNLDLLGKMLRIDVDQNINTSPYHAVPNSNPFVGNPAYLPEIWATGLRNPWRFSFDRNNGDLWIGDVGQNAYEEINFQPANSTGGEDYGWDVMEGNHCFGSGVDPDCPAGTAPCFDASYTDPIWETNQNFSTGGFSITGGFVYRGCKYPLLEGLYICADYATSNVWTIDNTGASTLYGNVGSGLNISTFGEDESGELYAASLGGTIYLVEETTQVIDCACPADLILNNVVATGVYQSGSTISSSGTVTSGSDVTFQSNEIDLSSDFEVENNAAFLVEIVPCTALTSNKPTNSKSSVENSEYKMHKDVQNNFKLESPSENQKDQIKLNLTKEAGFIHFYVPEIALVQLSIKDVNNKTIARLIEKEHRPVGTHSWTFMTSHIPTGKYTLSLKINQQQTIQKVFEIE